MDPLLFHSHHSLHQDDIPFWESSAARHPGTLLELGCGTGRVLLALAQAGNPVVGLDKDENMLAFLKNNLTPDLALHVAVIQADFLRFRFSKPFSLIIMPCNTYSTLPANDRRSVLACARQNLSPGGAFTVSMSNPLLLETIPFRSDPQVEDIFLHPLTGDPVQVSSSWERTKKSLTVKWHYDILKPDGDVTRLSTEVLQHIVSFPNYLDEMRQEGFTSYTLFGDFDVSAYSSDSPQLIIEAVL